MSDKIENPPAFPRSGSVYDYGAQPGMTLRDYFAGQALAGLLAHPYCKSVGPGFNGVTVRVAIEAYAVADAMLAERAKSEGK